MLIDIIDADWYVHHVKQDSGTQQVMKRWHFVTLVQSPVATSSLPGAD
jgi:hypothetical protein